MSQIIKTDTLIIGTGVAGLVTALRTAQSGSVTLVSKCDPSESNTRYAQGGITAVLHPNDSVEAHIKDTLNTGCGLSRLRAVEILAEGGASAIRSLIDWGTNFTKSSDSKALFNLDLGIEGGHSHARIVHAHDQTGLYIEEALLNEVFKHPQITILSWHTLVELITNHHLCEKTEMPNRCYGAYLYNRTEGTYHTIYAQNTVLATGGIGQVYEHTTNPNVATGDGLASAWRAGADIENMEFIQFHPTTLYHKDAKNFLISEALRGYGAKLKNSLGEDFISACHPMGALAPRDVVARAIDREIKQSGEPCVFLDITHADPEITKVRFPKIYKTCLSYGIDITKDLIPVVPSCHYSCGGIAVDVDGRTSINSLFAVGEVSSTGVHGANRLASNSLLEAVVFGERTAKAIIEDGDISCKPPKIHPWDDSYTKNTEEWVLISHNRSELRKIMWDYVGIVRTDERLNRALKRVLLLQDEIEHYYKKTRITTSLLELRNMAVVAELIVKSALKRKESRGLHFTKDYPSSVDELSKPTLIEGKSKIIKPH